MIFLGQSMSKAIASTNKKNISLPKIGQMVAHKTLYNPDDV